MKNTVNIAALLVLSGLAMTAGAVELNGVKAADVAVITEAGSVPPVSGPARAETARKAAVSDNSSRDKSPQAMLAGDLQGARLGTAARRLLAGSQRFQNVRFPARHRG